MRAAVIGIGWIGWKYTFKGGEKASHVSTYIAHPETELVAVSDVDRKKLEDFKTEHPEVAVYRDYEKMLSEAKPEIVSVCTPTNTHYRIVRNVARFEPVKAIFVEKPIATSPREGERMVRTCKEFGVKLAVNHTRRWDPAFRAVKRALEGRWKFWDIGELGDFTGVFSGGPLRDGVHMADLALWFRQENTKIHLINVETPYLVFDVDLVGEKGWIRIRDNGGDIRLYNPKPSKRYLRLPELEHMETLPYRYDFSRAMLNAVGDLARCARTKKRPECNGRCGLGALKLCLEEVMGFKPGG